MKQGWTGRLPLEAMPVGDPAKESGRGSYKKTLERGEATRAWGEPRRSGVRLGRSGVT